MISLRPKHLARYRDLAIVLMKHGHGDLVNHSGLVAALDDGSSKPDPEMKADAEEFARDLEGLGPTYIKLGQLLSTRPDILSPTYLDALTRLQDHVEPVPYEKIEEIITNELGDKPDVVFAEFQREPLATASLGQVHRATMRDGSLVAVKIQRPGVREQINDDLDALEDVAGFVDNHTEFGRKFELKRLLDLLRQVLIQELDYRSEAENCHTVADNLSSFEHIRVPRTYHSMTTARVLTMEYIEGVKITALDKESLAKLPRQELAESLFRAYLHQVLVDGFFHADPHPGNLCLTKDKQIALLDLGMVCRVPPRLQQQLVQLLMTIADGRAEETADITKKIGVQRDFFDADEFHTQITRVALEHQSKAVGKVQLGRVVLDIQNVAGQCGMRLPDQVTMLGKAMMNLDEAMATLDPDLVLSEALNKHATEIMQQRSGQDFTFGKLYQSLLEASELFTAMPERVNRILTLVSENKLKVDIDAINEDELIRGMQRIANRISTGLILAAVIIGASLMMHIETSYTLFGYPILAMLFFLIAAIGGLWMAFMTIFKDR